MSMMHYEVMYFSWSLDRSLFHAWFCIQESQKVLIETFLNYQLYTYIESHWQLGSISIAGAKVAPIVWYDYGVLWPWIRSRLQKLFNEYISSVFFFFYISGINHWLFVLLRHDIMYLLLFWNAHKIYMYKIYKRGGGWNWLCCRHEFVMCLCCNYVSLFTDILLIPAVLPYHCTANEKRHTQCIWIIWYCKVLFLWLCFSLLVYLF